MKSSEIKTENEINLHLAELELQKLKKSSRADRWIFIIGLIKMAALGGLMLYVALSSDFRESMSSFVGSAAQNSITWYILLAFVLIEIVQRIVRYRFK